MQFSNLGDYIRQRCHALNMTLADASLQAGFSRGYLSAIVLGTFGPSKSSCYKIAQFFSDPPNIALQLAGFFVPEKDIARHEEIARAAAALSSSDQQFVLELIHTMAERAGQRKRRLKLVAEEAPDYEP